MLRRYLGDRKILGRYLQYFFIIAAFAMIGNYFLGHREEWALFRSVPVAAMFYAGGFFFAINILASCKILLILRDLKLRGVTFFQWFQIFVVSRFISFHFSQGGNIYRIIKLKKSCDFAYTKSISMTIFFIWMEVVINFFITGCCVHVLRLKSAPQYQSVPTFFFAVIVLLLVTPYMFRFLLDRVSIRHQGIMWLKDRISDLIQMLIGQIHNGRLFLIYTILTLLIFVFLNIAVYICFDAVQIRLSVVEVLLFTVVLFMSRLINLTPGNIGLTELICGFFSPYLGITVGSGIIVSGVIRIVEYIILGVGTLLFYRSIHLDKGLN